MAYGILPTRTDLTAQYALGTEAKDPRAVDLPRNVIRYVRASGTIAANRAVTLASDNTSEPNAVVATSATGQVLEGVTIAAMDSQTNVFGWIIVKGLGSSVLSGGTWAQGDLLASSGTAGALIALATSTNVDAAAIPAINGVKISALDTASAAGAADVVIY
jgi:hypothetical protein